MIKTHLRKGCFTICWEVNGNQKKMLFAKCIFISKIKKYCFFLIISNTESSYVSKSILLLSV